MTPTIKIAGMEFTQSDRARLLVLRDDLTNAINECPTWAATTDALFDRNRIDAFLNPNTQRNATARERRANNPSPNGGHTQRGQRR